MKQSKNMKTVKRLHLFIMVGWPILVLLALIGNAVLFELNPNYNYASVFLIFAWLMYCNFLIGVVRNFSLSKIISQDNDFDGYLECMKFIEKVNFVGRSRLVQSVNRIDAYLMKGDYDTCYKHMMTLMQKYSLLPLRSRMTLDFYFVKFYGEIFDEKNFRICLDVFMKRWAENVNLSPKNRRYAQALLVELSFRIMLFERKFDEAREYMRLVYDGGRITCKYEFLRYCYFQGLIEYGSNNLMFAKHWFAQATSLGLHESMSASAGAYLGQLEKMGVGYSPTQPDRNKYYENIRRLNVFSIAFSMIVSLLFVLYLCFPLF